MDDQSLSVDEFEADPEEVESTESTSKTSEEEVPEVVTRQELSARLIHLADDVSDQYLVDAYGDPNLYPFELIHTALLSSIANSLVSMNEKLDALRVTND